MTRKRLRITRSWVVTAIVLSPLLLVVAAGGVASFETRTVDNFWEGLWWSVSLMATVGFINQPPETVPGAVLSVVLMIAGWLLLALVSASLASLFVREDVEPFEEQERRVDRDILAELRALTDRIAALEARVDGQDRGDESPG